MSVRADADTLRRIPIFADCDPASLQVLAFGAERQYFDAGEAIIVEGEKGGCAFLVLSGRAEIRITARASPAAIGHADPGALLGEVAMIGKVPYSVTAIALEPAVTARIDRKLFLRVAEAYPDFAAAVFKALAGRLEGSLQDLNAVQGLFDSARPFTRRS